MVITPNAAAMPTSTLMRSNSVSITSCIRAWWKSTDTLLPCVGLSSLAHAGKADWRSRMTEPTDLVMVKRLAQETPEGFPGQGSRRVTVMGAWKIRYTSGKMF